MTSFAIEPIYDSFWLAVLASAAMIAVITLVTPPTQNPSHRRWLLFLRWLAAGVLLLALFRPALLRTDNRPTEAALIVAADTSRSMTLPDGDGQPRWDTQAEIWTQLAEAVSGMDQSLALRLVAYDATARRIANVNPQSLDEESPAGELTDLSAATLAAIQAAEGQPIAGVVLMGDGTQTAPVRGTGAQRVVETLDSPRRAIVVRTDWTRWWSFRITRRCYRCIGGKFSDVRGQSSASRFPSSRARISWYGYPRSSLVD
ncbi:MAG: hypothetical protein AAGI63_00090 [Planctomycetota bacterium]